MKRINRSFFCKVIPAAVSTSPLLKNYLDSRPKITSYDASGSEACENEGEFIPPDPRNCEKGDQDDQGYKLDRNIK